jgi:hypothetical protein
MVKRPRIRALGIAVAALAAVGSGTAIAAPAMASSGANINRNGVTAQQYQSGFANCVAMENNSGTLPYCLFFSQGFGSLVWGSRSKNVGTISGNFEDTNGVTSSHPVRNDAASMIDISTNCNVTTWASPNFTGDFNWLGPSNGGNLTQGSIPLRNNEASISENNCT